MGNTSATIKELAIYIHSVGMCTRVRYSWHLGISAHLRRNMQRKGRENCNRAATPGVNSGLVSERLVAEGSWVKTPYIEPGSPWENGYIESFSGKLRDELPNVELFTILFKAQVLIENWRKDYNQIRPHSALGYRPPAPEAILSGYGSTRLTLSVVQ